MGTGQKEPKARIGGEKPVRAAKGRRALKAFHPLCTPVFRGSKIGAVSSFRRAPADTPSVARRPASSQSPLSFVSAQRRRKLHPLPCSSFPRVATSSISFASASGESSSISLRLLSPQKHNFCGGPSYPLRWASAEAPFFCRLTLQSSAPPTGACIWCSSLGVCTPNGAGTEVLRYSRRPGGMQILKHTDVEARRASGEPAQPRVTHAGRRAGH